MKKFFDCRWNCCRRAVPGGKMLVLAACMACAFVLSACGSGRQDTDSQFVVSIQPLRFIVEGIVGDDFGVTVLVPPGASPETYEPTPAQIKTAETANLLFFTGLIDFERALVGRLSEAGAGFAEAGVGDDGAGATLGRFVDLSAGIELIEGDGAHGNSHGDRGGREGEDAHTEVHGGHEGGHHHGVDPHIWVSPRALRQMAATAYARIHELYPDSISYTANYARFTERLRALDEQVGEKIAASSARSFLIFHPGLTYYARDYGLRQIALEHDGKEPSARQLQEVIALARVEGISKILYQSEFPRGVVEVVAAEIGADPVEIDVLGYDVVGNILNITELIAEGAAPAEAVAKATAEATVAAEAVEFTPTTENTAKK